MQKSNIQSSCALTLTDSQWSMRWSGQIIWTFFPELCNSNQNLAIFHPNRTHTVLTSYKGTEGDMSLYCFMASSWRSMEDNVAKLFIFKKLYQCPWTTLASTGCNIQFLRDQSICLDGLRSQLHAYQGPLSYFSFEQYSGPTHNFGKIPTGYVRGIKRDSLVPIWLR